jgi:hypothetical protein
VSGGLAGLGWPARLFAPRALRWSLVELCRRTTLAGWDDLQAAAAAGRGVALTTPAGAPWLVAARALAAWAGPLHLALPAGEADRRLARLACAGGEPGPRLAADPDAILSALAAGEKVLFVAGAAAGLDVPAIPGHVPRVTVAVERPRRGRYRLVFTCHPPQRR